MGSGCLGLVPIFQSEVNILGETENDKKGKFKETQENNAIRKKQHMSSSFPPILRFHSRRLWWGVSLPLPGEIVTADVSRSGNGGALVFALGGGWEIKNASNRRDDKREL